MVAAENKVIGSERTFFGGVGGDASDWPAVENVGYLLDNGEENLSDTARPPRTASSALLHDATSRSYDPPK